MKRVMLILLAASVVSLPAFADHVGVSISVGHPDFYGQIEIGSLPPPPVIREHPVLVKPAQRGVLLAPMYLRVPPNHAHNWRQYCARYNACGHPVYFVKDDWYANEYVPHYRETHHDVHHEVERNEHHNDHHDDHHHGNDMHNEHHGDDGHPDHDHDHDEDHHHDH